MAESQYEFDVIVIGAGHAGTEAALAAAPRSVLDILSETTGKQPPPAPAAAAGPLAATAAALVFPQVFFPEVDRVTGTLASFGTYAVAFFMRPLGGIIFGHMARGEIRRSNGQLDGDGLAITGLVLGWASVALWVIAILAFILFFGGLAWLAALNS